MRSVPRAAFFVLASWVGSVPTARADPPGPAMGDPPAAPAGPAAPAMGEPPGATAPAAPPPKVLTDAEAAPLLDGLRKAAKSKTPEPALAALDAIAGVTHEDFEAPLAKLLGHFSERVAVRAAACLGERGGPRTASLLWRQGWMASVNEHRQEVKSAVLAALGRLGARLDPKQYDEVEGLWKQAPSAEALNAVSGYFAAVKTDKRPCRLLATWLDEPRPGSVHDAANPPASYWEARWTLWQKTKPGAVAALRAITGQTFDSSAQAKAWFEANPKFGVVW